MKVFVAMVTAAGLIFAAYVVFELGSLREECRDLSAAVGTITSTTEKVAASRQREEDAAMWDDLKVRLTRLEQQFSTPASEDGSPREEALATLQSTLLAHGEEIAGLRADLEGIQRVRGALDETVDRALGAAGQDTGGRGGLERLMEVGALFRKSPDELTEEERARRDEITSQLRQRRDEWAIRAFDRRLEAKLTDQQKVDMEQLLAEEDTALEAFRSQELSEEQRAEGRTQIRAQTDQRAAAILSADQYESWKSYRSRASGRSFRFGQRR